MQYATPPNIKPPTTQEALIKVWNDSKSQQRSFLARMSFFNSNLGLDGVLHGLQWEWQWGKSYLTGLKSNFLIYQLILLKRV